MYLDLTDEAATAAIGAAIAPLLRAGDVVTLSGDLGMGKTSLARGLLRALGLEGEAASPTFPIVIPYAPPAVRLPVAHIDLYRIDDPDEVEELGLDEMREDGALLVEWPERGRPWPDALRLTLKPGPGGGRRLTWLVPAAWETRWPPQKTPSPA
jgi:tRNA threonylcarbamoyladenosine biosynthesis protein TsaE